MDPIVYLLGYLALFNVNEAQHNFHVDKTIQIFRKDYRLFRRESVKIVDRAFFNVYNVLNTSLFDVLEPINEISLKWQETCKIFRESKLETKTAERFASVCYDVKSSIDKLIFEREKSLMLFYSSELTSTSTLGTVLTKLFFHMELQMNQMWLVYVRNNSCIEQFMKQYLPSFEPLVDNMCFVSNNTILILSEMFVDVREHLKISKRLIMGCITKFDSCVLQKNATLCIKNAVRILTIFIC